jgi:hypothetical protein
VHPSTAKVYGEGWRSIAGIRSRVLLSGISVRPVSPITRNLDECRAVSQRLATLSGEWLGSGAEEGRAKLRNASGRCKEPLIR